MTLKNLPGSEPDVSYGYDLLGRLISASQTGNALSFGWDALSRKVSEGGPQGSVTFGYDAADRRTSVTYPGATALTIDYAYLTTGELDTIKQGATVLADYGYDNLGNRSSVTFANGSSQAFTYDAVSRLGSLTNDLGGTANDLTVSTIAYNPASQLKSLTQSNDAYAFTPLPSGLTSTTANGLNQQATVGGSTAGWDSKGNLTSDPTSAKTYGYSSENLLTSASGGVTLAYDPALRLYQVAGAATTRFAYDGVDAIAEYNGSNALQRRFVYDDAGQPVLWYEGTGTTLSNVRYLGADERGSVISVSDSTGAVLALNKYDEYGIPASGNLGRFQYTGQKWIPEIGAYDYKARVYLPHLGIFAQTDPIGQADSPNLYAYVLADPVNLTDPLGLSCGGAGVTNSLGEIVITACQNGPPNWGGGLIDPSLRNTERGGGDPIEVVHPGCKGGRFVNGVCTPNNPTTQPQQPSLGQKVLQCTLSQYGLTGIGTATGLIAAGQPIPGTKPFITPGSSSGSSLARRVLGGIMPEAGPFRVPTGDFVGGRLTGRPLAWTVTKGLGKAAARWVPFVGWGLLAVDAIGIGICTASK